MIEISWCIPVLNLLGTPTQPSLNQSILSSWLLPARRLQVSLEIYSQPGKGNSQMMGSMKRHLWDKGNLENSGKSTIWSKFGVAWLSEKLLHVELCLLIYFSAEGCPSSGLAATLLASTFCFPDPSPPKGLSTKWPDTTNSVKEGNTSLFQELVLFLAEETIRGSKSHIVDPVNKLSRQKKILLRLSISWWIHCSIQDLD